MFPSCSPNRVAAVGVLNMKLSMTILIPLLAASTFACGGDPGGGGKPGAYNPAIRAADFSPTIDNRYMPLQPDTVFRYSDGKEEIELSVTRETKTVMGVTCLVVHDVARLAATGRVLEDTFDWFAQDRAGNVWYFGEDTTALPEGQPPVKDGPGRRGSLAPSPAS